MEQRAGWSCRRLLAVSAVIVYSAVTFGFLALHAAGDRGWYPAAYFFTWDMFPAYYCEASRRIAIGRTQSGKYVRLHPSQFDRYRGGVHGDLTKVDIDRSGRTFRAAVEHAVALTAEGHRADPVVHVYLLEQYWPEKFNLPDDLYEAWAGTPKPDRKYWRIKEEFDAGPPSDLREREGIVNAFLFAPENPRLLAMLRIGVGLVLGYDAVLHWSCAIELYSDFGPALPMFTEPGWHGPMLSPKLAVLLASAQCFAFAGMTIGWNSRLSIWLACLLSAWLGLLDGATTFTKYSVVGLHLLVLLGCSQCGAAWSVDAWLAGRSSSQSALVPPWPRRLMQLLLCSIYLGAALTKIKSQTFAPGDLMVFSLMDDHWGGGRFGLWLSTLRHVPQLLSTGIILFEMLFPFLVWAPRCRIPLLVVAWLFHAGMWCSLHVGIFSPLMMVALLAFLEPRDLERLRILARRASEGSPSEDPSLARRASVVSHTRIISHGHLAAYLCVGAACIGAGYFVQSQRDDYGVFGRRRVEPLPVISQNEVDTMLAGQLPAFEDYIHSVELGSRFSGSQVFGSQHVFHRGGTLYVLAQFMLPHPALHLEGLLIAPDGSEAGRFSHRVEPAFHYAQNGFELPEALPTGPYRMILQANGYEVARKSFELK